MSDPLIDARLTIIEHKIDKLLALLRGGASAQHGAGGAAPNIAPDADLDGQYGDPKIGKDPPERYWPSRESFVGARFSDAPPEYLDAVAKWNDARAFMSQRDLDAGRDVEKNQKTLRYATSDAARARGHAARIRARAATAPPASGGTSTEYTTTDEEIPF